MATTQTEAFAPIPLHPGLIVDQVLPVSVADRAGLRPGMRLLRCQGRSLLSPAMLQAWEQNAPRPGQTFTLLLEWDGEQRAVALEWGETGLSTRPDLPAPVLDLYAQGKESLAAQDYAHAADCWSQAAQHAQAPMPAAWLHVRAGEAWEAASEWKEARDSYAQACALWDNECDTQQQNTSDEETETEGDERDTATLSLAWMARGKCCHFLGDLGEASTWLARAQQTEEQAGRVGWLAHTIHDQGTIAFYRGDLVGAQDFFCRALALREQIAPDSLDAAASLNNLGLTAWKLGQFARAQACFTRALRLCEKSGLYPLDVASLLNNLGLLAWQQGDLERAQECHSRALVLRERDKPKSVETAMSLLNLGAVAEDGDKLERAEDCYRRAYAIGESVAFETPGALSLLAECRINLGSVARKRGRLTDAQNHYDAALVLCERLAPEGIEAASCLSSMGSLAVARAEIAQTEERHADGREEFALAQKQYARALACCERTAPHSPTHADTLWDMGKAALKQGCPQESVARCLHAVEIVERLRADLAAPDARALLMARHTPKYASLIQAYQALNDTEAAFLTLERARARSFVEMLSERNVDFAADAPASLLARQQELRREQSAAYARLQSLTAPSSDTAQREEVYHDVHRELRRLEQEQQELVARMRAASPRYASLHYPQPISLNAAQSLLAPGTLLLSYLADEEQTYLFAITKNSASLRVLPVGRGEWERRAGAFRRALKAPTLLAPGAEQAITEGRQMYDLLIRPVQEWADHAQRLLICPDGPLHTLPFAALVTNPDGPPCYLGAEKTLHCALSMTTYAQMRRPQQSAGKQKRFAGEPQSLAGNQPDFAVSLRGDDAPSSHSPLSTRLAAAARRILALGDPLYAPVSLTSVSPFPALVRSSEAAECGSDADYAHKREAFGKNPATNNARAADKEEPSLEDFGLRDDEGAAWLQTRGAPLLPLPHTRREVEHIARLFPRVTTILMGAEATKTAAMIHAPTADVLHFACHGWFDARTPLSSGLLLSQPHALGSQASAGDNGVLQAWEIMQNLRLGAELVVLSACRTGMGQEVRGEGLIGLARAFQFAGAGSLVVSLWDVSDDSTSAFMQALYAALKAGAGKSEAMRQGIQALQAHSHWSHPYYWGAFVLIGDGD